MSDVSTAILARLSHGPAGAADLACRIHVHCKIPVETMYRVFFEEVKKLIEAGKVEANLGLCFYRLTTKECPDQGEKGDA